MKLTEFEADSIVACWKADALWGAVADSISWDHKDYFPYGIRIRVLLGMGNTIANNYLWDKSWEKAKKALMKYGIEQGTGKFDGVSKMDIKRKDGNRPAIEFRKKNLT